MLPPSLSPFAPDPKGVGVGKKGKKGRVMSPHPNPFEVRGYGVFFLKGYATASPYSLKVRRGWR